MQPIVVDVDVPEDLLAGYGAGALIRIERDTTSAFAAPTEITTIGLVADTTHYEYWDSAGSASNWYRARFSKANPVVSTDYSGYTAVQAGASDAYASVADLAELLPSLPSGAGRNENLLSDLLVRASAIITARCGRDFFRHPAVSGTEQRLYDVLLPTQRLLVPDGIVSLTTAEYASNTGGAYTALGSTDWFLRPSQPDPGDSYYEVVLNDQGSIARFYRGIAVVRLTGVFGYASVPKVIEGGCLALARQLYALTPTDRGAGATGSDDILLPRPTYDAIEWGRRRTRAWV